MLAARAGGAAIAARLMAAGAPVDARETAYDQTALMIAGARRPRRCRARCCSSAAPMSMPRRAPAPCPRSVGPRDNAGSKGVGIIRGGWPERGMRPPVPGAKTPLLYAARRGDLAVTQLLVEAGAELETRRRRRRHAAPERDPEREHRGGRGAIGEHEHLAVARYLVERGANVNAADWYGETPLWAAVDIRNLDVNGPASATTASTAPPRSNLIALLLDARRRSERAHERVSAGAALHHAARLALVGRLHRPNAVPARRAWLAT